MPRYTVEISSGTYYDIEADDEQAAIEDAFQQHMDMSSATAELQSDEDDDEEEDEDDDDEV